MDNASMQIPKDLIEPIIQAHVTKAVLEALGDRSNLVAAAIARVLNQEVDRDGRPASYHQKDNPTWLQHIMMDSIRSAALNAIKESLEGKKEEIKAMILTQMREKKSPLMAQLIEAMAAAFTDHGNLNYRLEVAYKSKE